MFKNFLKIAFRSIFRQKIYSLINIMGLAIGLACSIMIAVFIMYELSYDDFHSKKEDIYRLCVKGKIGEMNMEMAWTAAPTAHAFLAEFPDIIDAVRIESWSDVYFRHENKSFIEDGLLWADSSFFNIFDFKLIEGDPNQVLKEPETIVLTREMARKYFGSENPIGKTMYVFSDTTQYRVTGVVENPPDNSHMDFKFVASYHSLDKANQTIWLSHNLHTYFLLNPQANVALLEEKIRPVMMKYIGPEVEQFLGVNPEQWEEAGNFYGMFLQPLTDIHLSPDIQHGLKPQHEKKYIFIFALIAVFILIIACINFMNLSTARSANRAREVGMRKALGSSRALLWRQFIIESVLIAFISMLIAILVVELLTNAFSNMIRMELSLDYLSYWWVIPSLALLVIFVGTLAGSYPAFYLSSFRPLAVLSGKLASGMKTGRLRSILVVLQFTISIGLVVSTMVVNRQVNYLLNKELGYGKEQMLVIDRMVAIGNQHVQTFKEALQEIPGVVASTNSTMLMGNPNNSNTYMIEGQPVEISYVLATNYVDFDYVKTYKMELVQGRFLSPNNASDSNSVVVNESAVKAFNMEDPLSLRIIQPGLTAEDWVYRKVVGVVKDFHFESLHTPIQPYVFMYKDPNMTWGGYMTVRLETADLGSALAAIEKTWKEFTNSQPFEYFFVDEDFARHYEEEQRTSSIFAVFSILAIIVACLGLLGLSSYAAEQRTKEIGIRKVMGADVGVIVGLLSRETMVLVFIATIVSIPAAWFLMGNWLESFAFRIKLDPLLFLYAFLSALLVALVTVSFQAVNAALKNPADSLRYE